MTHDPQLNARIAATMARQRQAEAIEKLTAAKLKGCTQAISKAQVAANKAALETIRAEVAAGDAG